MAPLLSYLLQALLLGSLVYCVLALLATIFYKRDSARPLGKRAVPVSVLRPLSGAEDNTEANLRSVFEQQHPNFEVLLSVHQDDDPAMPIALRVMAEYQHIPSRIVLVGISPLPNAKVWSLRALLREANHEVLVMSDSDVRLPPDCLTTVTAELAQTRVALVTCPYRAVGGPRFWPAMESLSLNTEFLAGMLTARLLNGMDFAIGCTIATRKADLASIGGLERLQRYLAEDFMMGHLLHQSGRRVILSRSIIEHYIGNDGLVKTWKRRLRWTRSTRRSRGWSYMGELFTKTTALSMLLLCVSPQAWRLVLVAFALRGASAFLTGIWVLHDPALKRYWPLLIFEDIASFIGWVLGFFGKTITWRGRELVVTRDGSFEGV